MNISFTFLHSHRNNEKHFWKRRGLLSQASRLKYVFYVVAFTPDGELTANKSILEQNSASVSHCNKDMQALLMYRKIRGSKMTLRTLVQEILNLSRNLLWNWANICKKKGLRVEHARHWVDEGPQTLSSWAWDAEVRTIGTFSSHILQTCTTPSHFLMDYQAFGSHFWHSLNF